MIILRYIGKEIYKTMLFTVAVLLLILVTNQLVNLLNQAATGVMTAFVVTQAVLLGIPQYLAYMVPLGFFLGIIVVLGRMASTHELVSMHASGFSKKQLLGNIMLIALPVFVFVALLTFELAPLSSNLERAVLKRAVMSATLGKVIPGQFQELAGDGSTLYSEGKKGKSLEHVLLVESMKKGKSNRLPAPIWDITRATSVDQQEKDGSDYLVFHDGRRVITQAGAPGAEEFWFKSYGIRTPTPDLKDNAYAVSRSTADLWDDLSHGLRYVAEWQWRFAVPISILVFALIAFPLSRVSLRQGKFMRVFPAVLIYAIYVSLLFASRSWVLSEKIPAWIGLWWVPVVALSIVGGYFIFLRIQNARMRRQYD